MKTHRCPRCGKPFPNWLPIHFACLISRGKYLIISALFLALIILMGFSITVIYPYFLLQRNIQTQAEETIVDVVPSATLISHKEPLTETPLPDFTKEPTNIPTYPPTKSLNFITPTSTTVINLTSTPDYFGGGICPGAPSVKVQVNDLVIVVTTNKDRLILRSKPIINQSTELERLNYGTHLKIHDGPVCVKNPSDGQNYWFWEVKVKATGRMGWVADGDKKMHFIQK